MSGSGQEVDKGGLAAAVRADKAVHSAFFERESDITQAGGSAIRKIATIESIDGGGEISGHRLPPFVFCEKCSRRKVRQ